MSGVQLHIEARGLEAAADRLNALATFEQGEALGIVGAVAEGAARRRIAEEKAGPDGEPWDPWSSRHAATRRPGQSLLQASGALLDSLAYEVEGDAVRVGSNLVYAAVHQLGSEDGSRQAIPARPYLGLSSQDEAEIEGALEDFLGGLLR